MNAISGLLCGALFKPMRVPLLVGLALFAALPYLHWNWGYVTEQYQLAYEKLVRSSQPADKPYTNLVWLIQSAGVHVPTAIRLPMAAVAAVLTLGLCFLGLRRGGTRQGLWLLMAFAACYLMLFNPRTETNSYVIVIPYIAMAAALYR